MAGTDERQALAKLGAEHGWKHLVKSETTDSFGRGNLRVRVIWHDTEKINGAVVFRYTDIALDGSDPMAASDAKRLIAERGGVLPVRQGYIALQSEGHPIEFKDIEVQVIEPAGR